MTRAGPSVLCNVQGSGSFRSFQRKASLARKRELTPLALDGQAQSLPDKKTQTPRQKQKNGNSTIKLFSWNQQLQLTQIEQVTFR